LNAGPRVHEDAAFEPWNDVPLQGSRRRSVDRVPIPEDVRRYRMPFEPIRKD
jgi:hypothetical protein